MLLTLLVLSIPLSLLVACIVVGAAIVQEMFFGAPHSATPNSRPADLSTLRFSNGNGGEPATVAASAARQLSSYARR